jgi:CHAT domain-containing protein
MTSTKRHRNYRGLFSAVRKKRLSKTIKNKLPPFRKKERSDETSRYVVFVIRSSGEIQSVDLGKSSSLDAAINSYRQALRDPNREDVKTVARALSEKILFPLRASIGDVTQLLVSADGQLNLIPFESLVDDQNRYLVERYSITYLTSGRDLLRMQVPRKSKSEPLIVANPDFGEPDTAAPARAKYSESSPANAHRSITTGDDLSAVYFAPLTGTAEESRAIHTLFPQARVLSGKQATKESFKSVDAPSILHIATHGFFLQDLGASAATAPNGSNEPRSASSVVPTQNFKIENPLLRSGLALSGANQNKHRADDGILTALEASGLNLWGTKLVTLSACETGVGEVKNGEGVYGLRRAFFLAGTETLVMSLWSVSDRATRDMMTTYYTGLKQGLGRGQALRQAQLEMLKRKDRQHPYYWASFIQSGEWANLDGKR